MTGAAEWQLEPFFLLRIAGLPYERIARMRAVHTARWTGRVLAAEGRLHARRSAVADALERAVAAFPDDPEPRRLLLNLRRDVYNLRPPRATDRIRAALRNLDASTADQVVAWLDVWRSYEQVLAEGSEAVAVDGAAQRDALREAGADPVLRNGMLLAAPLLDRVLPGYLDRTDDHPPDKRIRRIERSLLEYLWRTAGKTSPFSTFTAVCRGRVEPGDGPLVRLVTGPDAPAVASFARLNIAVLEGVSALVLGNPELVADLPVRLTTGVRTEEDRLRYLRRRKESRPDGSSRAAGARPIDTVYEELFFLPTGPFLQDVLSLLPDGRPRRIRELTDSLVRLNPTRGSGEVGRHLGHLVRLGLLVAPGLQIDTHSSDPVAAYAAGIRAIDTPWADRVADRLDGLRTTVSRYPKAPTDRRRQLLAEIRAGVEAVHAGLGACDVQQARTLLYEDTTRPGRVAVAAAAAWEERILPALRNVVDLLPLFDRSLSRRLAAKGFFHHRYGVGGRCDDFLGFAHEFHEQVLDPDNRGLIDRPDNLFGLVEVETLDRARRAVTDRMTEAYGAQPADIEELELDDDLLRDLAAAVPAGLRGRSWSVFGQLTSGPQPHFAVNQIYAGHTVMFSRFADCFRASDLRGDLSRAVLRAQPPGTVFAEMNGGLVATNLNLHPDVTHYELVCPGETSARPTDRQIDIDDLYIVDDLTIGRPRLRSRRLDVDVVPLYLGFLYPLALPQLQQVLLTFSPFGAATPDLWNGVPAPGPVTYRPRLRHGSVVLSRRSWTAPASALPRRHRDDPARLALDWARWRREHRLPRLLFETTTGTSDAARPAMRPKPHHIDLDQLGSQALLSDLADGAGHVSLTEMLPDPDQLWLSDPSSRYVTELVIELTRNGRPPQ